MIQVLKFFGAFLVLLAFLLAVISIASGSFKSGLALTKLWLGHMAVYLIGGLLLAGLLYLILPNPY